MTKTDADPPAGGLPDSDDEDSAERGFFSRFFDAFGAQYEDDETDEDPRPAKPAPGLMNLRRMRVEDVAIPSVEIVSVPIDIGFDDLVATFRDSGLTRLPVYESTLDTPRGMVHLKDFTIRHGFGADHDFDLPEIIRPLIYAPPSMPIGVLLTKMQSERTHMALVIDEYGGVDGLVTIEDLIEQVIGEIADEHDEDEDKLFVEEGPGVYIAQARTPRDAFEDETGLSLFDPDAEEEVDTLGGVVVVLAGRVPARGEVLDHPSGAEFEIVDADPRRLKRLRVRLPSAQTD